MINVSNMPYVSYLNSYTKYDATDEEFDEFINKIDKNTYQKSIDRKICWQYKTVSNIHFC